MNLLIVLLTAALAAAQHSAMPAGMSHEEHLKQTAKDDALKQRGGEAMGFDQDSAEHHFILGADGGSIQVTVKPGAAAKVLTDIRNHLQTITSEFAKGDFAKPFQTHAEAPPGVDVMKRAGTSISFRYEEIANGGTVRIASPDAVVVKAIHDFLRYQITEHKTGDPLRPPPQ